jgi:DNA repair exonuclease SbcCD ATPase subunit
MTTHLSISIPVYKKNRWDRTKRDGKIEVSSDVNSISEGYEQLKQQLDKLLAELDAQNRLAESALVLENQIAEKAYQLKNLTEDIERATQHYKTLKVFLEALGIDPRAPRFTFDEKLMISAAITRVEQTLQQNYGEF